MNHSYRNIFYLILLGAGTIYFVACSGGRQFVKDHEYEERGLMIPAGVDSATAIEADSLASNLFVSFEKEEKADSLKKQGVDYIEKGDSLWKYLTMKAGEKIVTRDDSIRFLEAYNKGALTLKEILALKEKTPADSVEFNRLLSEQARLLDLAQESFEKAIQYNPYDNDAKNYLAYVYQLQAVRLGRQGNLERVAQILERLTRIIRGEHSLFAKLGEVYFAMKEWQKSYNSFKEAERVLLATADLQFPPADTSITQIDTSAWFQYVYYQGYNATNLRQAELALRHLKRALQLAENENSRKTVQSVIDWINWDDGNIAASEERDRIFQLEDQQQFEEAANAYRQLLKHLRTQRAKDEIQWRLALIEFNFEGEAQKQSAIRRLQRIVERYLYSERTIEDSTATLQIAPPENASYPDSLKKRYINAYGTMLYNLGAHYLRKKSRKMAFTYFYKSAQLQRSGQAKALLQIGVFSKNDPQNAIAFCEKARSLENQLSLREKKQLFSLLAQLYKQIGAFDKAREYYILWRNVK